MDDIIKDFHDLTEIPPFQQMIPDKKYMDTEEYLDVLQMNIGRKCNLICKHCHVNAGPARTEEMSRATIFTSIIWWLWHLPIFFIIGTANANMNYFLFGIMCLTLCYALATIRKVSKGVFPCIFTHCLINGLSAIFVFNYSLLSCCITLIVTIIVSILILNVNKRYIR